MKHLKNTLPEGTKLFCQQTQTVVTIVDQAPFWTGNEHVESYEIQYSDGTKHFIALDRVGKDYQLVESNVQKLVEWLELEPTKAIKLVFNYGTFKQPIGVISVCYRFDGTQTLASVLLQAEEGTELVDNELAGTFLGMLPPHIGMAA